MTRAESENKRWLDGVISRLPARYQAKARKGWQDTYDEAYAAEPIEHQKQNAARRAANTRLRQFVGRVSE